jgi:uncharacterized protein YbjQ (UPF0145 family)
VCKSCVQFTDEDQFSFLTKIPTELQTSTFCETCYSQKVVDAIENYKDMMEKARQVNVFEKSQIKETRFLKRKEKPVKVLSCADRDEAILRLAFRAVELGFDTIIDMVMDSKKVSSAKYHTTVWNGSAIPVNLDPRRLVKDRSIWHNPN